MCIAAAVACTLIISILLPYICECILFPNSSVLQLTASISIPIQDLRSYQKGFFDLGFQMNYMLPSHFQNFYNKPMFSRSIGKSLIYNNIEETENSFETKFLNISASEIYEGIENLLKSYYIHKSCLLKSICEVASNRWLSDFVTTIVTWILKPSLDGSLDEIKQKMSPYKYAEQMGACGINCSSIYIDCQHDILNRITK